MTAGRLLVHAALALLVIAAVAVRESAPAQAQLPPVVFVFAMVDGATLTLGYDGGLDTSSVPDGTDFAVSVNNSSRAVDGVSIRGPRVKLTLSSAVVASDTVVMSYTPGSNPLKGWASNDPAIPAAAVTNEAVANNTALCESEAVIADHADHPELVADCKVLWSAKETLEGHRTVRWWLNWGATLSLSDWDGVRSVDGGSIGGDPKRLTRFQVKSNDRSGRHLGGEVPAAFGSLTELVTLTLHWHANLHGGIPEELGNLVNLTHLEISSTRVSGEIPSSIGKLTKLERLDLGGNDLGGDIPSEIWDLTELRSLDLHSNSLTGTIPAEIKDLTKLQTLHLHINSFSGSIPAEIGELSDLTSVLLYEDGFTGPIPVELADLTKLKRLHLYSNELTGPIPSELGNLAPATSDGVATLVDIRLFNDGLTGCIPARLFNVLRHDLDFIAEYVGLTTCGSTANPPPEISSATVVGATLTLRYNEGLDTGSQPVPADYAVSVTRNGSTTDVDIAANGVSMSGSVITLTLDAPVVASDVVVLDYAPGSNPVQD